MAGVGAGAATGAGADVAFVAQMSEEPQGSSRPPGAATGLDFWTAAWGCIWVVGFGAERLKGEESKAGFWIGGGFFGAAGCGAGVGRGAGLGVGVEKSSKSAAKLLVAVVAGGAGGLFIDDVGVALVKSPKPSELLGVR